MDVWITINSTQQNNKPANHNINMSRHQESMRQLTHVPYRFDTLTRVHGNVVKDTVLEDPAPVCHKDGCTPCLARALWRNKKLMEAYVAQHRNQAYISTRQKNELLRESFEETNNGIDFVLRHWIHNPIRLLHEWKSVRVQLVEKHPSTAVQACSWLMAAVKITDRLDELPKHPQFGQLETNQTPVSTTRTINRSRSPSRDRPIQARTRSPPRHQTQQAPLESAYPYPQ